MRIALQTITGSTYTSDELPTDDFEEADEAIDYILSNGFVHTSMHINGRKKFFRLEHIVWMQGVS